MKLDLDQEFRGYLKAAYPTDPVESGSVQWVELRRAFMAGVHWAACQCRPDPTANMIMKVTSAFATNIGDRRN